MEIQKFSPAKAEIQSVVEEVKDLTIKGIDDVAGYEAVKSGKKKLAEYRIDITKFGKKEREEALTYQREVLRQEKELLEIIEPTELRLKEELEMIDSMKKIEERKVLLPARVKMLEEIEIKLLDTEILRMDEVEVSTYFTEQKMIFLERQEAKRKADEDEKIRAEEIEKAKQEAVEKARAEEQERAKKAKIETEIKAKEELERVEREKQEAIEKIKKEQEEKEQKTKEEEQAIIAEERSKQERAEKNKKYKEFLAKNGYSEELKDEFFIERKDNIFTLYKKIDSITI